MEKKNASSGITLFVSFSLAVLIAVLVPPSAGIAQQTFIDPQIQPHILRGVDFVTNTDYAEAHIEFEKIMEQAPDDPSSYFLKGMIYWYKLVVDGEGNKDIETLFFTYMDRTIEKAKALENRNKDSITALFWLGAGYGYKARYHSVNSQWWSAYRNGKRTKHYFERVVALSPQDYDPYLGLGIYHYYAEVVPKIIRIFDFILNMGGDRELGLRELEMTLDKGFFTQNEARLFLVDIFLNYEHRPWQALPFLLDLAHRFPGNRGFKRQLAQLYGELGLHEAAAHVWRELADAYADSSEKKGTALVHLGEQTLASGQPVESQSILLQAVQRIDPLDPSLLGRAYFSLALASDLLGRGDEALTYHRKVVEIGKGEMVNISEKRLRSPGELPVGIVSECARILATAKDTAGRMKIFEERAHALLSDPDQHDRKLCLAAMEHIGSYYLFHGDPATAKRVFSEALSSDLPLPDDRAASLYRLRGVANYRLNRFTESVDDLNVALEKAKDDRRDRIEKELDCVHVAMQGASSSAIDLPLEDSGHRTLTCDFTCPDRGQLAVSVVGDFNDWDPSRGEMSLISGQWIKAVELHPGKHAYCFLINGHERRINHQAMSLERRAGTQYVSIRQVTF